MKDELSLPTAKIRAFVERHRVHGVRDTVDSATLGGDFSLVAGASTPDLYGMLDAVYCLYTLGQLPAETDRASRAAWARKILACQDAGGWFTKLNFRGHSREHATAYAIGALRLLEVEPAEVYVGRMYPLRELLPILTNRSAFLRWIEALDFSFSPGGILKKNLGWHYIWRGSHVGGGIPAAVGMTRELIAEWWPGQVDVDQWFHWLFVWLDTHANPQTGYWQRAFWNYVYRQPTAIDMGGAAHFFWIYAALGRMFPYPEAVIESTLALQAPNGLYKEHPFCIDLDGNFSMIRAFLQLSDHRRPAWADRVYRSAERSFEAIVKVLTESPLERIYRNSHDLPGALAALAECGKLPGFQYAESLIDWRHPLDRVWWL